MNGLRRLKVVWAVVCLVPTSIAVVLLLLSTYRPELMHLYAVCTLVAGSALAAVPYVVAPLRERVLFVWICVIGPIAVASAITNDMPLQAALAIGSGLIVWALWAAADWVRAGFAGR